MFYFALYTNAPLSEQRQVLYSSDFGTSVLLSPGVCGGVVSRTAPIVTVKLLSVPLQLVRGQRPTVTGQPFSQLPAAGGYQPTFVPYYHPPLVGRRFSLFLGRKNSDAPTFSPFSL